MKTKNNLWYISCIFLAFVSILTTGCGKNNTNNGGGVVIKGKISTNSLKSSNSLTLSDAKKVFVVTIKQGTFLSNFVDITDGSFSIDAQLGLATALVFLGDNNAYIGTLSSQGLNLLPLGNLTNGDNTTIDLATLTLVGTCVIPSHDPLGNEIIIDQTEIDALKDIDGFFETLAKNIDSDNDGSLDVLTHKQLFITTRFGIRSSGHWGINNTAPVLSQNEIGDIQYSMQIDGDYGFSNPTDVVLTGPSDSPYPDIQQVCNNSSGNGGGFYSVFVRNSIASYIPFQKGTYTLTIGGKPHTMDYSNIDAKLHLLLVYPTLHTNSDGKLVSISLQYKSITNDSINPVNIVADVMVQMCDDAGNQFYYTPRLINENDQAQQCDCVKGLYSYTLPTPLDISNLKNLGVVYDDLLGDKYFITWYP